MPAYFTVVRYVPDVVRDERVNIGIIVFSETDKRAQFLGNWHRVKCLGGNAEAIKAVCAELEHMDLDRLRSAIEKWTHSIQLSSPCASLLDLDTLLLDTVNRFLVDPQVTQRGYKTKADVLRRAKQSLREAVTRNVSAAARKLIRDDAVPAFRGAVEPHAFDIYACNGGPIFGANAISFEVPGQKVLRQQVDATKWAVEDLRDGGSDAEIAVVVSRPSEENEQLFEQSRDVFRTLGARVEIDTELEEWANNVANRIRDHLPAHLRGVGRDL